MLLHTSRRPLPYAVFLTALAAMLGMVLLLVAPARGQNIIPGGNWRDTSGNPIQAHGAGMVKVGGTYYWLGENDSNGGGFQGVNCYSSTDLANWNFVGTVLQPEASGDLQQGHLVERPKVLFNASTNKYVMWMHIYSSHTVGYATSNSVCGNYTYIGSSAPLGNSSFDIGSFQDTDGTAYLLSANYNHGIIVYKMASDYLSASSIVDDKSTWGDREAPTMFKVGGTYFMICSYQSGWAANDNQYSTAPSIGGPWTALKNIAPSNTDTYTSQSTWVQPITGSNGTTYIYMGDRWLSGHIGQSSYIWLPLSISGTTLSLPWYNNWTLNAGAGTWANASFGYLHKGSNLSLVNFNSGLCLDSVDNNANTSAQGIYCGATGQQQWNTTSQGSNYSITAANTGFLLEGEGTGGSSSASVQSSPADGGTNQQWLFTNVGNGNYTVKDNNNGLCLGIKGASIQSGAAISEGACNSSDTNQMWYQR